MLLAKFLNRIGDAAVAVAKFMQAEQSRGRTPTSIFMRGRSCFVATRTTLGQWKSRDD
jgi:hypothetical protein